MLVSRTEVLQSQLEIREHAFRYFFDEIHDNVGQVLSAVSMNLHQLELSCREQVATGLIRKSACLLHETINQLRDATRILAQHDPATTTLTEAIRQQALFLTRRAKFNCTLSSTGQESNLHPDHHILLFRTVQQGLHIAAHHAKAKSAAIIIHHQPQALHIELSHNGNCMDSCALASHRDIAQMHARCMLLRGSLSISETHPEGNVISITIPHTTSYNPYGTS